MKRHRFVSIAAVAVAIAMGTVSSHASMLYASAGGVLGGISTINGVPMGSGQPFSFVVAFDGSQDTEVFEGWGTFSVTTAVFDLPGYGTYTAAPGAGLGVDLMDPESESDYWAFFLHEGEGEVKMGQEFVTATPALDADVPVAALLSDPVRTGTVGAGVTVPCVSGDTLYFDDVVMELSFRTVQIVPEPLTSGLVGLAALVGIVRHRRRL